MTRFVPYSGGSTEKHRDREVLFLGQYGKKNEYGPSDIARNVNLDKDRPAIVTEVMESERIIFNPFNRNEPSFGSKSCRVVRTAFPKPIPNYRIVLSKPLEKTNKILVRVNTCSADDSTNRRGGWTQLYGRLWVTSDSRGVKEYENGFIGVAWTDDLIVMCDESIIKIVTEGSDEIDDQVLINMNGRLIMAPAGSFYMSGIQSEPPNAETIERDMVTALSEQGFTPEMPIQRKEQSCSQ